ncbi:DUF4350 domain-containing protein [Streptomyces sp. SP18CS02]|uniref:DUF4350 domain-containing protein n=1 Tax=Streptomyces sp. SP18CS02 TaxID=3002531 RepID=UPI002E766697|nr:DUF4350 domain-containing protein [Streptomyces sp. SP18CS02]MEE1752182.1 DUF4350 domain-containing protein [Streptomyces sp. SP18CS02]
MTATSTSASLTPGQLWARVRGLLIALGILLLAAIVMALVRSGDQHGRLDPRSADPQGSRAVAELLRNRGITSTVATTLDEAVSTVGPATTLLVTAPDLLTESQQTTLHEATKSAGGRTILLSAGAPSLDTLAPGVRSDSPSPVTVRAPRCALPAAQRAGDAELGGERYATDIPGADGCYLSDGMPTLLRLPGSADGDTVLLGSPDILYNDRLAHRGNASLALQLLGSRTHVVWYLPSLSDASATRDGDGHDGSGEGGESTFVELVPSGWLWGTLQLALAAVLAAIWRARRLGPLVTERLPVAIRASESTEGRARLYRKANARDRAAAVLRSATRTRLAPLLGVPLTDAHAPETLLPAVSARLASGDRDLRPLLFGPVPTDDAALTLLADQLDALEREVRTS